MEQVYSIFYMKVSWAYLAPGIRHMSIVVIPPLYLLAFHHNAFGQYTQFYDNESYIFVVV